MIKALTILAVIIASLLFIFREFNPIDQFLQNNDKKRKSDLLLIQDALEKYYQANFKYPLNVSATDYRIKGFRVDHKIVDFGEEWKPYIDILPKDPNFPSKKYVYYSLNDGQAYYLYASLEREAKDKDACNSGKACESILYNNIAETACGGVCNYGVSSRNVSP